MVADACLPSISFISLLSKQKKKKKFHERLKMFKVCLPKHPADSSGEGAQFSPVSCENWIIGERRICRKIFISMNVGVNGRKVHPPFFFFPLSKVSCSDLILTEATLEFQAWVKILLLHGRTEEQGWGKLTTYWVSVSILEQLMFGPFTWSWMLLFFKPLWIVHFVTVKNSFILIKDKLKMAQNPT